MAKFVGNAQIKRLECDISVLKLTSYDALICVQAFVVKHYKPRVFDFPEFEDTFRALLRDAETAADLSKHAPSQRKQLSSGNQVLVVACVIDTGPPSFVSPPVNWIPAGNAQRRGSFILITSESPLNSCEHISEPNPVQVRPI